MENSIEKKYQSEDTKELFAALAKAQAEMVHAGKSTINPYYKAKFADLPAVIDASRPALVKNGLSVNHFTDIENGEVVMIYQLNHSSGQWMRGWYPIKPIKSDPQGLGSAITYAKRYTYSAITGVVATDDDDDGNDASGNNAKASKPVFSNSSLRKTFCDNVIKSFEACESVEEANTVASLNKAKLDDMRNSGNEHDEMAADELSKRYKQCLVAIKERDNFNQQKDDFSERK